MYKITSQEQIKFCQCLLSFSAGTVVRLQSKQSKYLKIEKYNCICFAACTGYPKI